MKILAKAAALLHGASMQELEAMPPAQRRRLADVLRHWLRLAEPPATPPLPPRSGVLADLRRGYRSE